MSIFKIGDLVTTKKKNDNIFVVLEIDDKKFFLNNDTVITDNPLLTCKCLRTQKDYIFEKSYVEHII